MSDQPAGPMLDALGVTLDVEDNQQITEAMVIAKVVDFKDNITGLVIGSNSGLDWISQHGLVAAAQFILCSDEAERG